MIREIALFTSVALVGAGVVGCGVESNPEKQIFPELQTQFLAEEGFNNLVGEFNSGTSISAKIGACAVRSSPDDGLSVVVINPPFGEIFSTSGQSKEDIKSYGFIAKLTKNYVALGSLGAQYKYTQDGKMTSKGPTDNNFRVVEMPGKKMHDEKVIPTSNVIEGTQTPPSTMTLYDGKMPVGTTIYRTETPSSEKGVVRLCIEAQRDGTNFTDDSFGTYQTAQVA